MTTLSENEATVLLFKIHFSNDSDRFEALDPLFPAIWHSYSRREPLPQSVTTFLDDSLPTLLLLSDNLDPPWQFRSCDPIALDSAEFLRQYRTHLQTMFACIPSHRVADVFIKRVISYFQDRCTLSAYREFAMLLCPDPSKTKFLLSFLDDRVLHRSFPVPRIRRPAPTTDAYLTFMRFGGIPFSGSELLDPLPPVENTPDDGFDPLDAPPATYSYCDPNGFMQIQITSRATALEDVVLNSRFVSWSREWTRPVDPPENQNE